MAQLWKDLVSKRLKEKGWSQTNLAQVVGVTPATISRLLKEDDFGTPDLKVAVSNALNITESWTEFKIR